MRNFLQLKQGQCWRAFTLTFLLLRFCLPAQAQEVVSAQRDAWDSPTWAGSARLERAGKTDFRLLLPAGRPWTAAVQTLRVNIAETPVLAVSVRTVAPGATWLLKLDNTPYDVAHPHDVVTTPAGGSTAGRFLVDLREVSGGAWRAGQSVEVRLFVTGPPGSWAQFGPVVALPEPSGASQNSASLQVAAGAWTMAYAPEGKRLQLRHAGARHGIAISLPGITNAASAPEVSRTGSRGKQDALLLRIRENDVAYEARVTAVTATDGTILFHWTVDAHWLKSGSFPVFPAAECRYESSDEDLPLRVLSAHRFGQSGLETGQAFLPQDAALAGTALYVQSLGALAPLFEAIHTSVNKTVTAETDGFGFHLPTTPPATAPIMVPAGTKMHLADAFIALTGEDASVPSESCRVYTDLLAAVYRAQPKPTTVYTDWKQVAEKTLVDLLSPTCWSNVERGYLRNYVNEPWPPQLGELTVQVDPLVASLLYEKTWQLPQTTLTQRIVPSLPDFYLPSLKCIRDYTSEDKPTKNDSWYRVYPLIQLARAAELGIPQAKTLVRDSLDATIAFAHKCNYDFPIFYNPQTLGVFEGAEPDCGGAYAYLMLQAHRLFGEERFREEARNALARIAPHGMNYAYELHLTALTVAACAQMWKVTGEEEYLELSLVPLANVLRHCWIYEPGYGMHKEHHLFFALSAMSGTYTAPFEQYQAWLALREYDELAHDALPRSAQLLVSEFLKYGQTNLRYMYPSFMTPGAVVARNERGAANELGLLIPVEDVNDGWATSGHVGQELYGSGGPLAIAARTFVRVPEANLSVYSEYPLRECVWNAQKHVLRLKMGGVAEGTSLVAVRYESARTGWKQSPRVQVVGGSVVADRQDESEMVRFRVPGEAIVLIDATPATPKVPPKKPKS